MKVLFSNPRFEKALFKSKLTAHVESYATCTGAPLSLLLPVLSNNGE